VSAYQPYQAYPGQAPVLATPPPVLVAISEPVPQRRVTVAFRLILAIPQVFVLHFVLIGAFFVAFIGWWGALFTGRLPQFAVTYLSGMVRWSTRVEAYCFLLTDVYPPFTFDDDPTYPVRVAIPEPQRLNRAAVFFRYFLAFPVSLLSAILLYGCGTLAAFIAWLIALVTGQLPPSLYLAYAAVVRFQARYYSYLFMLTPAYPGGLYGDKPGTVAWADVLPAAPGFGTPGMAYGNPADSAPQGYGAPPAYGSPQGYGPTQYGSPQGSPDPQGYGTPQGYGAPQAYGSPQGYGPTQYGSPQGSPNPQGYGTPQGYGPPQAYGSPQGYGAATGYGAPAPGYGAPAGYGPAGGYNVRPVFQPATWLLPLTAGARNLVTTFIVLGALLYGGATAVNISSFGSVSFGSVSSIDDSATATVALDQLNSSYATLSNSLTALSKATSACAGLTCVTKEDAKAASAFGTFSDQLANTTVPAGAAADKAKLAATAAASQRDFTQLSEATSAGQYQSTVASSGYQQTLNTFDSDFNALTAKLQSY
jgi:hypothetical protein